MAISFPRELPTFPSAPAGMSLTPYSVVASATSPYTLSQQQQVHPGQLWQLELSYGPMTFDQARAWIPWLLSLNGAANTFLVPLYGFENIRGSGLGSPVVNGSSQVGDTLSTTGWTINETGVLLEGDFFGLGSGATSRIYTVLEDVNSDGSGNADITIWPALRESPSNLDALNLSSPKLVARKVTNTSSWSLRTVITEGISIQARESLSL